MMPLAVPSLALNCQISYLFSETSDNNFLGINRVKNGMMYSKNRMVLLVRVLILHYRELLHVILVAYFCCEILSDTLLLPIIAVPMLKFFKN